MCAEREGQLAGRQSRYIRRIRGGTTRRDSPLGEPGRPVNWRQPLQSSPYGRYDFEGAVRGGFAVGARKHRVGYDLRCSHREQFT